MIERATEVTKDLKLGPLGEVYLRSPEPGVRRLLRLALVLGLVLPIADGGGSRPFMVIGFEGEWFVLVTDWRIKV